MADEEPTWEQIEAYLQGAGWSGGWHGTKFGVWKAHGKYVRLQAGDGPEHAIAQIAIQENVHPGDLRADIIAGRFPERLPSETDWIVTMLERAGLNAMMNVHETRRQLEAAGKRLTQSLHYRIESGILDATAAQLGEALWIQKHGKPHEKSDGHYDPRLAGLERLHTLRKEREKERGGAG